MWGGGQISPWSARKVTEMKSGGRVNVIKIEGADLWFRDSKSFLVNPHSPTSVCKAVVASLFKAAGLQKVTPQILMSAP